MSHLFRRDSCLDTEDEERRKKCWRERKLFWGERRKERGRLRCVMKEEEEKE